MDFGELRSTGLLWLVNASVFHPRGFALGLLPRNGGTRGWQLLGDGSKPWRLNMDCDAEFAAAEAFFDRHRKP